MNQEMIVAKNEAAAKPTEAKIARWLKRSFLRMYKILSPSGVSSNVSSGEN